ncbi:MAG: IMP dehydrogenase [Candidatus Harrisonbacteria bacterium]|nr:IMP dehydrogenase [Candidatus Harrisonbacteria bacterium]
MRYRYDLTPAEYDFVNAYLIEKGVPIDRTVTFDDMPLEDDYSEIESRASIYKIPRAFEVELAPGVKLGIPIILANMECVAGGDEMRGAAPGARAITAIQQLGGLGIPPQTLDLKMRLDMLEKISRTDCAYINNPLTIHPNQTLREAKRKMRESIRSLIVVDMESHPVGVLSHRDWKYETDDTKLVKQLMGGRKKLYTAPKNISFEEAGKILRKHRIEKLPLINKKGRLAGLLTAHGLFYKQHYPRAISDGRGRFLTVGSVGVGKENFEKHHLHQVEAQVEMGICLLLIDTARAFSINMKRALETVRKHFPDLPIMAGNTCSPRGAKFLFEHGADIVKVGIGPGNACTTRRIGIGVPSLSAVVRCAAIAKMDRSGRRKIVADGGFSSPAHIFKAIGVGADAIMSGRLFIGTYESAAEPEPIELKNHDFVEGEIAIKKYTGMASLQAQRERVKRGGQDYINEAEGRMVYVPVTCSMKDKVDSLLRRMASAMSYRGMWNIKEIQEKFQFDKPQSSAGLIEGTKKK